MTNHDVSYTGVAWFYEKLSKWGSLGYIPKAMRCQKKWLYAGAKVLYCGAGTGSVDVSDAIDSGAHIHCIDNSEAMCRTLASKYPKCHHPTLTWECTCLDYHVTGWCDVVVMNCFLNMFENPALVIKQGMSHLKEGGIMLCVDFDGESPSVWKRVYHYVCVKFFNITIGQTQVPMHNLRTYFQDCGLECVEVSRHGVYAAYALCKHTSDVSFENQVHRLLNTNVQGDVMSPAGIVGRHVRAVHYVPLFDSSEQPNGPYISRLIGVIPYVVSGNQWVMICEPVCDWTKVSMEEAVSRFMSLCEHNGVDGLLMHMTTQPACVAGCEFRTIKWANARTICLNTMSEGSKNRMREVKRMEKCYYVKEVHVKQIEPVDIYDIAWVLSESDADAKLVDHTKLILQDWRLKSRQSNYISTLTPKVVVGKGVRLWYCFEKHTDIPVALTTTENHSNDSVTFTAYMQRNCCLRGNVNGPLNYLIHSVLDRLRASGINSASFGTIPEECPSFLNEDGLPSVLKRLASYLSNTAYNASNLKYKKKQWERNYELVTDKSIYAIAKKRSFVRQFLSLLVASGYRLQIPCFPKTNTPKYALVVGAGYSGVLASQKLTSAGYKVVVVEESSQIGGCWQTTANEWSETEVYGAFYLQSFKYPSDNIRSFLKFIFRSASRDSVISVLKHNAPKDIRFNTKVISNSKLTPRGERIRDASPNLSEVVFQHQTPATIATLGNVTSKGWFDIVYFCTGITDPYSSTVTPEWVHTLPANVCVYTADSKHSLPGTNLSQNLGDVIIVGNGSFAMEALDRICKMSNFNKIYVVARHFKWVFPKQWRATNYLLFLAPIPMSLKIRIIHYTYRCWKGSAGVNMLPRSVAEMKRWYTGTTSECLYSDPRVNSIIGNVTFVDPVSGEVFIQTGDDDKERIRLKPTTVVLATGSRPKQPILENGVFMGDIIHGLGVWSHHYNIGAHTTTHPLPSLASGWPRTITEMHHRASISWSNARFVDKTRFIAAMCTHLLIFFTGSIVEVILGGIRL